MTVTKTFHYGRGDKFVEGDSFAKVIEQVSQQNKYTAMLVIFK